MTTLVAKTRVKYGSKITARDVRGAVAHVEGTTTAMPGETFEVDAETAKRYLADGVAITQADARASKRDEMTAEEKLQEAAEEARAAGLNVDLTIGGPGTPDLAAHREHQAEEDAAIEQAKKDNPAPKQPRGGSR